MTIKGSEIIRYNGRPTENCLYSREDLSAYIPSLNEEAFIDWVKERDWGMYGRHIKKLGNGEIMLGLDADQRCYADMTVKK